MVDSQNEFLCVYPSDRSKRTCNGWWDPTWHCTCCLHPHSERHYHCKCHSHRQLKGTLASFPPPWTNMCREAWYCNRVWTTYSISKQFPNCFQAKADAYMEAIPAFNLFIWRLGNITVLRKLNLRIANSLENSLLLVHSDPRWRCISLNLCGPHVSTLFKCWEVTVQGITLPHISTITRSWLLEQKRMRE